MAQLTEKKIVGWAVALIGTDPNGQQFLNVMCVEMGDEKDAIALATGRHIANNPTHRVGNALAAEIGITLHDRS